MLTLKAPMELNSCRPLVNGMESFAQRLLGNYDLMGLSFGPKELLFLLSAPPELPTEFGGMTSLAVHNEVNDQSSLTLDVVNHVVNRILLQESPSFTYQDQVYITSILQKLGITDFQQFMREIRQSQEENRSVYQLLSLYQEEKTRLVTPAETELTPPGPAPTPAEAAVPPSPAPRYYLQNDIYRRLETGDIYAMLHAYSQNLVEVSLLARDRSLHLSEHLRVSRLLQLNQLRGEVFPASPLTLRQSINRYELGDLLPAPQTEAEVLSQAAEAALFSSVEHVAVQALSRTFHSDNQWVELGRALSQTIENTLNRYESYHSSDAVALRTDWSYSDLLLEIYHEENIVLEQFRETRTALERELRSLSPAPDALPPTALTHPDAAPEEPEVLESAPHREGDSLTLTHQEITNITQSLLSGGPKPVAPVPAPPVAAHEFETSETLVERTLTETKLESVRRETVRSLETLSSLAEELVLLEQTPVPSSALSAPEEARSTPPVPKEVQALVLGERATLEQSFFTTPVDQEHPAREDDAPPHRDTTSTAPADGGPGVGGHSPPLTPPVPTGGQDGTREAAPLILRQEGEGESDTALPAATLPSLRDAAVVLRRERQRLEQAAYTAGFSGDAAAQPPSGAPFPPSAEAAREEAERLLLIQGGDSDEGRDTLLVQELREIDQRNRAAQAKIAESLKERTVRGPSVPDAARTMADALRSINAPEEVLRELVTQSGDTPLKHPAFSSEVETLLQQADPATRAILETVLRHEANPHDPNLSSIIRSGNLGELNAETRRLERESVELTQRLESQETLVQDRETRTDSILHELRDAPTRSAPPPPTAQRGPLHFVHKQESDVFTEEFLQQLAQRQTTSLHQEETTETTRREVHETQVSDLSRQVTAQTTEDLTALINRTLSKQMGTISDQVYRQMEKRLQTERYRRGRF